VNRKQRRRAEKTKKKLTPAEQNLSQKIFLFDKIPDTCTTCAEPFDKKDKTHAQTWRVVVHKEKEQVRLFCPTCIEKTKEILENG
jgi:hypothetical protein